MPDYELLDLSPYLNAGVDVLGAGVTPQIGQHHFRGLPFLIGDDPTKCFIALDRDSTSIHIPVGHSAFNVIFAHRLIHSGIAEGGPVGVHIADYVFVFEDGQQVVVPIRERFEIGVVPTSLFQAPFRAVPDDKHQLMPRHEGAWNDMGRRQTEYTQATARSYLLWSWINPRPQSSVRSVEIVPKGPAFVVAAVTLGLVDEYPFSRQGRREAVITFDDPELAQTPFDVEVEVDRGDSTYVFPLPKDTEAGFLDAYHQGFGEAQNETSDPSYVEISAVSSATVSVRQGGRTVGRYGGARWNGEAMRRALESGSRWPTAAATG